MKLSSTYDKNREPIRKKITYVVAEYVVSYFSLSASELLTPSYQTPEITYP